VLLVSPRPSLRDRVASIAVVGACVLAAVLALACQAAPPGPAGTTPAGAAPIPERPLPCALFPALGLDVECRWHHPPPPGDTFYMGDFCRSFVRCTEDAGACVRVEDPRFQTCRACVAGCTAMARSDAGPPAAPSPVLVSPAVVCIDECRAKLLTR
jgi:hypothetical protein